MKLVEIFTELAGEAEENLGNLANRQEANLQRREALQQIEARFHQMAADGYIDEKEMGELMRSLSAQGLDSSSLRALFQELKGADSSVRGDNEKKFADALESLIGGEIDKTRDSNSDIQFQIQLETADATNYGFAASQLSKQEHQVYMHIIGNLKA